MSSIQTNRDLYVAIANLGERHQSNGRSLEEYLRALWQLARAVGMQSSFTPDEFFELLSAAFNVPPPPFDEVWRSRYPTKSTHVSVEYLAAKFGLAWDFEAHDPDPPGFTTWEHFVLRQIVDLREMTEHGSLNDPMRYLGIDSPRGERWYNFTPCAFLEAAAVGCFGGWQSGDATGRIYVPGPVAIVDQDGRWGTASPEDMPNPIEPLGDVTWADFRSFLGCGQWYE
jgi:hypothetical protein